MKQLTKNDIKEAIQKQFQEWFELTSNEVVIKDEPYIDEALHPDFKLSLSNKIIFVDCKTNYGTDQIWPILDKIRNWKQNYSDKTFLLVVPYMPNGAREKCREYNISWMDLSGNAHIKTGPFHVHVEGKKNRFQRPGPKRSVFAPKTSKIPMVFLLEPQKSFTVKELAKKTDLNESTVSRATRRLKSLGFIQLKAKKGRAKPYKLLNPYTMLDAWRENYEFSKHEIIKGTLANTANIELIHAAKELLLPYSKQYALSGPQVSKFYNVSGTSSLIIAYTDENVSQNNLEEKGFKEGVRGANIWVAQPSSDGVFMKTNKFEDIEIVNRIQMYLDLSTIKAQRSEELAEELRKKINEDFRNAGF